jgi:hypothetical protein
MTEVVDLELSAVWEDLEAGQRIIEAEEHEERKQKERFEKALEEAKRLLFAWLPDAMQPYAKLIDLEVVESEHAIRPDFGWFSVKVPDLALITAYVKCGTPPEITYWVHDPAVVGYEIGLDNDWDKSVVYHKLEDHRVALARAYDVMRKHMWVEHGTVPGVPGSCASEPHYEPFSEDLIDSDGQFDGPVAALWTEYKLHELVRLIGQVVDQKLATR